MSCCVGPKNIVLCFDGTENQFGPLPFTNVLKLFKMLEHNSNTQVCYYQPGIGVGWHAGSEFIRMRRGFFAIMKDKIDAAIGRSIGRHVKAGYKYLMKTYNPGDTVIIFGFSRGAFTARILSGMIERVGLLHEGLDEMTGMAYEIYSNWEYAGQPSRNDAAITLAEEFKKTFSKKISIKFMGLWDTINSVGWIRDFDFPFTARSEIAMHVRHAVSIDERRVKYRPVLFDAACNQSTATSISTTGRSGFSWFRRKYKERILPSTCNDVVEKWFPGNHGDVGGGWPADENGNHLSDVSLRWIISEVLKVHPVQFKPGLIEEFNIAHSARACALSYEHDMLSFAEPMESVNKKGKATERQSFKAPRIANGTSTVIHEPGSTSVSKIPVLTKLLAEDQSSSSTRKFDGRGDECWTTVLFWWLLEVLPFGTKEEDDVGKWTRTWKPNFGSHRKLPANASLHWSVFYRMEKVPDYRPTNLPFSLTIGEQDNGDVDQEEASRDFIPYFRF